MKKRIVGALVAASALVSLTRVPLAAQAPTAAARSTGTATKAAPSKVLRTPWGDPDLQGTWDYRTITPLERPGNLGDRAFYTDQEVTELEARATQRLEGAPEENPRSITVHAPYWTDPGRKVLGDKRTSLIIDPPDGRVPPTTAESQRRAAARRDASRGRGPIDGPEDRSLLERCITWGLPTAILPGLYNNNIQIVQGPGYVAIVHEMVHDVRIVPLDGRPRVASQIRPWLGESRGRWEGNTLVVETTNFSAKTNYRGSNPETLRLVERFTRVDARTLGFELTVHDPTTWTRPWTVAFPMIPSEGPIYEYACHEGNYGLRNMLEVARDEEKAAAEAAK